jgi:peptidoglycan/xylan/chitin deacetylase (PgdA/CDA1 family)
MVDLRSLVKIFTLMSVMISVAACSGSTISRNNTSTPQTSITPGVATGTANLPTAIPTVELSTTTVKTAISSSPCIPSGIQSASAVEIGRGTTNKQNIILTFDAGGAAEPTARILDILARRGLKTTWFLTGDWANTYPDLARRVRTAGHEIGNHTMTHPDLTQSSDINVCQELSRAESTISSITGTTTRPYFRPPYGARDDRVRSLAAGMGYRTVYWTIDTIDWRDDATPALILQRVLDKLQPGAIILMHAGSAAEAEGLDQVITAIQDRGYQIVTLSKGLA